MFRTLKGVLKDITTERDGESYHNSKVFGALGVLVFLACECFVVYHNKTFDPVTFGSGFGMLLAATGFGVKLQENTEQTIVDKTINVSAPPPPPLVPPPGAS